MSGKRIMAFYWTLLILACPVHLQDRKNLALYRPARQRTTYGPYTADKAVNGDFISELDFSHTDGSANQWWMVDLGQIYGIYLVELVNRPSFYERLSRISILTSLLTGPSDPYLYSSYSRTFNSDWTEQSYQYSAYGERGVIPLSNGYARHVAVFNTGSLGVTLKEVYVFESLCFLSEALSSFKVNTSQVPGCVTISWNFEGFIGCRYLSTYRFYCDGQDRWTDGSSSFSGQACFPPSYAIVKCQMQACQSARCETKVASAPPGSCKTLIDGDNSLQVKTSSQQGCVTVSWNFDDFPQCNSIINYEFKCEGIINLISNSSRYSGEVCFPLYGSLAMCQLRACQGGGCVTRTRSALTGNCRNVIQNISAIAMSSTCLSLNWSIVGELCNTFKVNCSGQSEIFVNETQITLCGLEPGSEMTCLVSTNNSLHSNKTTAVMPCSVPILEDAAISVSNASCVLMTWSPPTKSKFCDLQAIRGNCSQMVHGNITVEVYHVFGNNSLEICGFDYSAEVICNLQTINIKQDKSKLFSVKSPQQLKLLSSQQWVLPVSVASPVTAVVLVIVIISIVVGRKRAMKNNQKPDTQLRYADMNRNNTTHANKENIDMYYNHEGTTEKGKQDGEVYTEPTDDFYEDME